METMKLKHLHIGTTSLLPLVCEEAGRSFPFLPVVECQGRGSLRVTFCLSPFCFPSHVSCKKHRLTTQVCVCWKPLVKMILKHSRNPPSSEKMLIKD